MKKLLIACSVVLALLALPAAGLRDASADTTTTTVHGPQPIDVGPGCGLADVLLLGTRVFHETTNSNGDWVTSTEQGPILGFDANGNVVFTGHGETWFGSEDNLQNNVQHFVANVSGKLSDGTNLEAHVSGDVTTNANGQVTASHSSFTCR